MTTPYKPRLVLRVIEAVQARMADPTLNRPRAETALRKLGMSPGGAQRLLDDSTDVRIGTLIDAAARLGTSSGALLAAATPTDKQSLSVAPPAITLAQALPVVLGRLPGLDAYTADKVLTALLAATKPLAPLEAIERDLAQWLADRPAAAATPPSAQRDKRQSNG